MICFFIYIFLYLRDNRHLFNRHTWQDIKTICKSWQPYRVLILVEFHWYERRNLFNFNRFLFLKRSGFYFIFIFFVFQYSSKIFVKSKIFIIVVSHLFRNWGVHCVTWFDRIIFDSVDDRLKTEIIAQISPWSIFFMHNMFFSHSFDHFWNTISIFKKSF